MIVGIASGKGGTGKTTAAVSLALSVDGPVRLLDCDVEEPNARLFLLPEIQRSAPVGAPVPVVDAGRCTGCGDCADFCAYNALACVNGRVLVFTKLCHGCGGCATLCPEGAVTETEREIGSIIEGRAGGVAFVEGRLNVGEAMAPPLIRAVKAHAADEGLTLIDAPPGTACPMIAAVKNTDFVVLVTDSTPFGLHDLTLAVETVRELRIPFGVVINRCDLGDGRTRQYCDEQGIPVLLELADDRRIAEAYSRGIPVVEALPELRSAFRQLAQRIEEAATEQDASAKLPMTQETAP